MTEKLQQIAKEEIAELPKDLRDVINASNWVGITEEIGKKYTLTEVELNDLQAEVLSILVNVSDLERLSGRIENEIGLSGSDSIKIADELQKQIFEPITNTMIEKAKTSLKTSEPNLHQNISFTLSGGNYLTLVNKEVVKSETSETKNLPLTPDHPMKDIKKDFAV